jgi:tetratricopeptide (TPR) repeat protein
MLIKTSMGKVLTYFMFFAAVMLVVSCSPKDRIAQSQLDTPEHHVFTGLKLLGEQNYLEAQREFDLAIQLDSKYSKGYTGVGLVKIYTGDFKAADDYLDKGWNKAKNNEDKIFVHVSRIRYFEQGQTKLEKKWLKMAKNEFDDALKLNANHAPAYYFMGLAYKAGLEFNQAGEMFTKVLELKAEHVADADLQWNFIQKVQRAMPGTATGKQIALVQRLTRADAAALFMEELNIEKLYKKRTPKTFDTSFKDPEKASATVKPAKITAKDIGDNPLRIDIEGILNIGVRGLETFPDGNFQPAEQVTRAAYAMMIEDILIKVSGDNSLATKFIGTTSPFPDLRSDLPYFNSVMVVTSRGIMEAKDLTTAEFEPLSSVAGVDALLIIRKLKEELKFN